MNNRSMIGMSWCWALVACLAWSTPALGQGGSFMDVRLTWTFGDDDVLHRAGDEIESPLPDIRDRPGYELFYDNLDTRYSGRENITHLVLYKQVPSLLNDQLVVDIAAVMLVDFAALYGDSDYVINVFRDDGSYIRLTYNWSPTRPHDGLEVILFPLDTDRVRVGYLYDLSWGGRGAFSSRGAALSPGLKLQLRSGNVYAFVGMKVSLVNQQRTIDDNIVSVRETNYGTLAGVGMDALPWLRFDVSGGFFQMSTFQTEGADVDPAFTYGGAARLVFHQGIPIRQSPDFMLYRNDPEAEQMLALREEYVPGQFSWSVAVEGHALGQHLHDADADDGASEQLGWATALQVMVKYGYLRAHLTGMARSPAFLLQQRPSLVPFDVMDHLNGLLDRSGDKITPEYWGALGVDYHFARPHLTLGATAGVRMPSFQRDEYSLVWLIGAAGYVDSYSLPDNETPVPEVAARLFLQWDAAEILTMLLSVQYVRDPNHTFYDSSRGEVGRLDADRLGLFLTAQGRF